MKNMFIAFILNLAFALFELIGGIITGSVAIASDAIHDLADSISIGISILLERKSRRNADSSYTFGYGRLSVLGGLFTTFILLLGSIMVIYRAVMRIIFPATIDYRGMILFAIIGVVVNLGATLLTKNAHSANQRAVNLHLLEDVLGWVVLLIGAIIMRYTNFALLDPILSIAVALFITITAMANLKKILIPLLEKVPPEVSIDALINDLTNETQIRKIHDIHVWSLDGENHIATAIIATNCDSEHAICAAKKIFQKHGIHYVTIEIEPEEFIAEKYQFHHSSSRCCH